MKTKAKVLSIILCVLSFVVAIVVLFSTLFCVSSVNVVWHTTQLNFSGKDDELILKSQIKNGESIFLVPKEKNALVLEQTYPYLKVLSIESVFPNKINLHLIEREALFCIQYDETKYAYLDQDFKVLEVFNGVYNSTINNPILLKYNGSNLNYNVADFVCDEGVDVFKTIQINFEKMDFNIIRQKAFIKDVSLMSNRMILNTFTGVQIQIFAPAVRQQEKIAMTLKVYETLNASKRASGVLGVFENTSGVICGSHYKMYA